MLRRNMKFACAHRFCDASLTQQERALIRPPGRQGRGMGGARLAGSAARVRKEIPMFVDTILKKKGDAVVTVEPECLVSKAAKILHENRIGAALVRDESGAIVGILSERDIVRGVAVNQETCLNMQARDLMTHPVISCSLDDSIDKVMEMMTDRRIRHLPVMDRGTLLGIISIGDVVKQRISEIEHESEALRQYISAG
jgi:CBS domain-containing protein